ncbi:extracellular ribonuclease LE-like [Solanum lycopersicum]|uniref:extracellular ribonuclease LE-like n=1 Tax=Solanum lycopersicum TaxID=4081 RepID=UPI0037488CBE
MILLFWHDENLSRVILSIRTLNFDFFYFVQQWPPALCDQKLSCYSTTVKPTLDFGVHGLRPNYDNGSYPSSCDITNLYDETKLLKHSQVSTSEVPFYDSYENALIKDLISSMQENWPTLACLRNKGTKFWSHEWDKHVTCSLSTLDEHSYFKAALTIKEKVNILSVLKDARIEPGGFYSVEIIKEAVKMELDMKQQ